MNHTTKAIFILAIILGFPMFGIGLAATLYFYGVPGEEAISVAIMPIGLALMFIWAMNYDYKQNSTKTPSEQILEATKNVCAKPSAAEAVRYFHETDDALWFFDGSKQEKIEIHADMRGYMTEP